MFIFGPIDPHTWPSEAKNWNYGCQSSFVTHHWHLYWVINSLSLLPGTAKGGRRRQSCVTLTLAPKLFFFKGFMREIRKTEMREFNFWCAAIAQNFLLIFSLFKISRKLHERHSLWKEKRKSVSFNGTTIVSLFLSLTLYSPKARLTTTSHVFVQTCLANLSTRIAFIPKLIAQDF